jgi:hypothetical protein
VTRGTGQAWFCIPEHLSDSAEEGTLFPDWPIRHVTGTGWDYERVQTLAFTYLGNRVKQYSKLSSSWALREASSKITGDECHSCNLVTIHAITYSRQLNRLV